MKTEIIYISDMHIKDKGIIEKVNNISNSLNMLEKFDDVIIFFGGDIAYSGISEQYKIASKFIGKLKTSIKKKYNISSKIYMVPGNHDLNFYNKTRTREEGIEAANTLDMNKEKNYFKDFLWLASDINHCFEKDIESDIKIIETCNVKVQLNLLNSALFSILDDKDSDEGIHVFSENTLQKLKKNGKANYVITLMHHSPYYFKQSCKETLINKLVDNSNILLYGHEHIERINAEDINNRNLKVIRGGCFSDATYINSQFLVLELDWNTNKNSVYNFVWNNLEQIYEYNIIQESITNKKINYSQEFTSWLQLGSLTLPNVKYSEYFEFPQLLVKTEDNNFADNNIITEEEFKKECDKNQIIEISGDEASGKTTLLKYIIETMFNDKMILYVNCKEANNLKLEKVIENSFEKQYSRNKVDYQKFCQLNRENKIIILDDFNVLKKINKDIFIKNLLNKYFTVIYTINNVKDFDLRKDINDFIEDQQLDILRIKILPFYKEKRLPLLRKVCKCLDVKQNEQDLEVNVSNVERFISGELEHFALTPEYLIMFTKTCMLNLTDSGVNNPICLVFDTNIANALQKIISKGNVNDILQILQILSYEIHFNKEYYINQSKFCAIVENFNYKHRTKYSSNELLNNLFKSKVLVNNNDKIGFANKSYLAYFVAKRLNRLVSINPDKCKKDLQYLIDNLCKNINADIILFLTYITENTNVLQIIVDKEKEYVKDLNEFNIKDDNIVKLLSYGNMSEKISLPTTKEKGETLNRISESEREYKEFEEQKLSITNIYDEEELTDFIKTQRNLIKYLEIMCKILPSFYHLLEREQQDIFVEEIYSVPNKLINFMLEPFSEDLDDIVNEFLTLSKDKNIKGFENEDEIRKTIARIFQGWILAIWDLSAIWSTDTRSINALDEKKNLNKNITYKIQNVMMYENLRKTGPYIEKSNEIYDDENTDLLVKHLIRKIFRKHCITVNIKYHGSMQSNIKHYGFTVNELLRRNKKVN